MNSKLIGLIIAIVLIAGIALFGSKSAKAYETKKVCHEENDKKSGKMKEVCKTQKVHKKLEGTAVPEKKK